MSSSSSDPLDLLDLKLLPAWVKESPDTERYAQHQGEGERERPDRQNRPPRHARDKQSKRLTPNVQRPTFKAGTANRPAEPIGRKKGDHRPPRGRDRPNSGRDGRAPRPEHRHREDQQKAFEAIAAQISVHFMPHPPAFENVAEQIKSSAVAYSIFSLARLFLEKPERYDVQLTARPEFSLYRLGQNGALSIDRQFLETSAFRFAQADFYKVDITQGEPIKGNFSSVARCNLSGTLLGPTNHHGYQPRLRNLYEQRFSRRMSFADYQRQIEIVSDPALVEQWKDEVRRITTFTTLRDEPPLTFNTAAEAERHFRQSYLPGLVETVAEIALDGVTSRKLPDRNLLRLIEDAWSKETRSPSQIIPELAKQFREKAGLQIFRHRRGMLFVSPIRVRPFTHEQTGVSSQVSAVLGAIGTASGINRKELAEKLIGNVPIEEAESRKLSLASDLRWLISEGHVIEFNDGSLDLPRVKAKEPVAAVGPPAQSTERVAEKPQNASEALASLSQSAEIGGA